MKNKYLRKKRGITVISLVVTIIILLLLAGIVVIMLTGDNGVLTRSGEAKEKIRYAEIEEKLKLSKLATLTQGNNQFNLDLFQDELEKMGEFDLEKSADRLLAVTKNEKYLFEIDSNGNIEYKGIQEEVLPTANKYMIIRDDNKAFWQEQYRTKITKVITKYSMYVPNDIIEQWDVSASKEVPGSVIAYLVDDGNEEKEGYVLYICADGRIKVPSIYNPPQYRFKSFFQNFTALEQCDLIAFNTEDATNMDSMFSGCSSLTSVNLKYFDTKNVKTMQSMFAVCLSLTTLDLTSFDTSSLENMNSMFTSGSPSTKMSLTTIKGIENFNTQNVKYMESVFKGCNYLTGLDLSRWNTKEVTTMKEMFYNCASLSGTLDFSSWDINNVERMAAMFTGCGVDEIIMPGSNTKLQSIGGLLQGCTAKRVNISGIDASNLIDLSFMFHNEAETEFLDMSNFDFSNVTTYNYFIRGKAFSPDIIIKVKDNTAKQFFMDRRSSLTNENFVVVNDDSTE